MIARVFSIKIPWRELAYGHEGWPWERLDGELRDRLRWWLAVVGLVLLGAGSPALVGPPLVTFASGGTEATESRLEAQLHANAPTNPSTNSSTYASTNPPTYASTNPSTYASAYASTNPPTHASTNPSSRRHAP